MEEVIINKEEPMDNTDYLMSLKEAFENFNKSTSSLTEAYQQLQVKFNEINFQLDKKNRELEWSLAENKRIKNHLNNILESMNSGVVAVDLSGRVTMFNKAAEEITGWEAAKALGKDYKDVMGKNVPEKLGLNYTLISGQNIINKEKVIITGNNKELSIGFSTSYLTDEKGDIHGAVEIFRDLSGYKKLEEELIKQNTLAALGEMAATVAHEIRNPLGGINGFAKLLAKDLAEDPDKSRLLSKIIQGVESLNRIVTNLLTFTREFQPKMKIIKLSSLLEYVKESAEGEIRNRGLDMDLSLDLSEKDLEIKGDRDLLSRALYNVVLNAVDAVEKNNGNKISIHVSREKKEDTNKQRWEYITKTPVSMLRQVYLLIEDDGKGISPSERDKIFNPFFTTKENGTGLGLAIVKKIIALHNGSIELVSARYLSGGAFLVKLPGLT